ncbi:hypothetical protein [Hydrogenoanaerobacterium sp.]|uniref:hypothetical protein n=1 Tax=Hydrogenoanaerobacterium sp. TaxID=2953763 RepID=UPI00289718E9|nr:hypothetical protein [Hydrogenoanaerobacterium sp.]
MQATYIPVKKKKYRFLIGLGIFFAVLLIAIAGGLFYLWGYLERYEANTPNAALQRYVDLLKAGDYETIYATSGFEETRFAGKEEYINYIKTLYKGKLDNASFIKKASKTPDTQLYDLYLDKKRAGSLEVVPSAVGSAHRWAARAPLNYFGSVTIDAPSHVKVLVNGKELTGSEIISRDRAVEYYKGVHQQELAPKQMRYEVKGLLLPPTVTAQKNSGEPCMVAETSKTNYYVLAPVNTAKQKQHQELLEKAAKTYAAFITQDASFSELWQYLNVQTEFYNAIKDFYNGWYIPHDSYECRNIKISELTEFSENDFTGNISFDYVIKKGTQEYVYPSSYQLSFIKLEEQWKLVNIVTL